MRHLLSVIALTGFAFACSSTGSGGGSVSGAAKISVHDYRTEAHMEIVNDSHLVGLGIQGETPDERRLEFYSTVRGNAGPKVTTDEIMDALIDYLDANGFDRAAVAGSVDAVAPGGTRSIEILTGARARHVVRTRGMDANDARSFNDWVVAFYETYNAILQLQAFDAQPGEQVFEGPLTTGAKKR